MSQPQPSRIAGAPLPTHIKYSRVLRQGCQELGETPCRVVPYSNTNGSPSANNTLTMIAETKPIDRKGWRSTGAQGHSEDTITPLAFIATTALQLTTKRPRRSARFRHLEPSGMYEGPARPLRSGEATRCREYSPPSGIRVSLEARPRR